MTSPLVPLILEEIGVDPSYLPGTLERLKTSGVKLWGNKSLVDGMDFEAHKDNMAKGRKNRVYESKRKRWKKNGYQTGV